MEKTIGRLVKVVGPYLPLLAYAVLALIIMLPLAGPGYYLVLDMQFGPNTFADFQFGDLYGTASSQYGAYLPVKLASAFVSQFLSVETVQKGLLLFILLLCGAGMHLSLPRTQGNSRYFAGLFYMLNPFVFVRFLAGHWSLLLSYAIWPLAIRSFMDFLDKPKDWRALAVAALLTSMAAVSSHGVFMLLLAYLVIFVIRVVQMVLRCVKENAQPMLAAMVGRTVLLGIVFILMNLYWIVPTFMLTQGAYNPSPPEASLAQFGSQAKDMPVQLAVLTLHGFWRGGFVYTKDVFPLWFVPFIIMLLIVAAGLLFLSSKDFGLAISIAAIGAIGFLLALGASSPISSFFSVSGNWLPLYLVFRDTQKFVGLLCLAYAWLGAYGTHAIVSVVSTHLKPVRIAGPFLMLFLISLPILSNIGFFGFFGQIGPTQYPDDWYRAEEFMKNDTTPTNLMVFPPHLYYWYDWVNGYQKILGLPASQFFSKPVVAPSSVETQYVNSDMNDGIERYMGFLFDKRQYINDTAEMLLPLNVRYIILLKGDEDSIHYLYLFSRKGGMKDIELLYEGPTIYLFRNNLANGPFFTSKENGSGGFGAILADSGKGVYSPNVSFREEGKGAFRIDGSGYDYLVTTSKAYRSPEAGFLPWHALGGAIRYDGPITLSNPVFPLALSLFLLSWMLCILLIARLDSVRGTLVLLSMLAVACAFIYIGVSDGAIHPPALGALMLISVGGAFCLPEVLRRLKMAKSL